MIKILLIAAAVIASVTAGGKFSVLHHPQSLSFKGNDHVKESSLKEVYAAALGFTTEQNSNWQGMFIEDPFNLAEGIAAVIIDGVGDIGLVKGRHFPLVTDEDGDVTYNSLRRRILERYPEDDVDYLLRVDLSSEKSDVFDYKKGDKQQHKNVYLKHDVDEDREFLKEIDRLNGFINTIESQNIERDNIPDIYWIKFSTLHALQDLYGENSTVVIEAKQLLNDAIIRLNNVMKKIYDGNVLTTVVTSDASHTRKSRSILQAEAAEEPRDDKPVTTDHNLAKNYDQNYPVIFNIILWFGVAMVFSLLAICLFIADMDPGRDSIIYRMTSNRMKKES